MRWAGAPVHACGLGLCRQLEQVPHRTSRRLTELPTEYDAGKAALEELIQWVESNVRDGSYNEADTRLNLIDRLLVEVLRWPRSALRTEQPSGTGRIDYALGSPGPKFILEAKREGAYFDLPAGTVAGV